jgi:type VI secretion system secreted protein VgrG
MAKLVKTTIHINGIEVNQFHQFSLNQGIFAHHTFKLVCPAEALDDIKNTPLSKSKNLIGSSFKVKIENFNDTNQPLQFLGLVTQVEAAKYNGHTGDIIVSGYSPTILMDNAPNCKSWDKKALKNIANDVFNDFPKNLLSPSLQPTYGETIPYTVQYKETAWQFMNRLAATYGEWFFYTGEKVWLGSLKSQTTLLTYGSNLSHLTMAMQLRPGSFSQIAYDYMNTTTYTANPEEIKQRTGLNDLGNHAYKKSDDFFAAHAQVYNASFVTNQKQLNEMTNTRAAAQASNLVRFTGASTHFGVQLGNTVRVDNNHGSYSIIEVNHSCNGIGNYSNEFVAVPETIKVPPATNYAEPHCETQSAVVTDNFDKQGLGRIRVRFHWMSQDERTPWLRMLMPHAGGGKGSFFIPEIGEEVMVAFENASPTKPYVQGTLYNSSDNNDFSNEGNDIKIIQTRSGTKMRMDDAEGSIFVEDPSGNTWHMDGQGNISVNAPNDFSVTAGKNIFLNAGMNMATTVGMNKTTLVGMNASTNVGINISESAGAMITQAAGADFMLVAQNIIKTAVENISTKSTSHVLHAADEIGMMSGGNIAHNADKQVKVYGDDTSHLS